MVASNTKTLFDQIVSLSQKIEGSHGEAAILFVDLAGSTECKVTHGYLQGLQKTFIHNSLVTRLAEQKGRVVKYIGDEVMILIDNDDAPRLACELAMTIQREFRTINSAATKNDHRFPIHTKIAIHFGKVLLWEYDGASSLDPQGTVIDAAARLASIAKPEQILCSDVVRVRSQLGDDVWCTGQLRDFRGLEESLRVFELFWDGCTREISEPSLPLTHNQELIDLIREGREELGAGRIEKARKLFLRAVAAFPKDYMANIHMAELSLRFTREPDADAEQVRKYLDQARRSNPNSAKLWTIEGFYNWEQGENGSNPALLDKAIDFSERALRLAELNMDYEQTRIAQGNLAYFLAQRGRDSDLDRAIRMCEATDDRYRSLQTREHAGFLDTFSFVLMRKGGMENIKRARTLLEEAIEKDPRNPYLHQHMADLLRLEERYGLRPPGASRY